MMAWIGPNKPGAGALLRAMLVIAVAGSASSAWAARPGEADCADARDNDHDGFTDCLDSDCAADPACLTGCPDATCAHASITGPFQTPKDVSLACIGCHPTQGDAVAHSVHGTWSGNTPDVINIAGQAGKWGGTNTYCTDAESGDFACLSCHNAERSNLNNVPLEAQDMDCLTCHQDAYRFSTGPAGPVVQVVDWQGQTRNYTFPAKGPDGEYHRVFRFDLMAPGTTAEALARSVHLPTRTTCLSCHAKAGGGDGTKRGDLNLDSADPARSVDVHLSSAGADLTCQSCHTQQDHRIAGRGIDLRVSDGPTMVSCVDCHAGMDSGQGHAAQGRLDTPDRHVARVACQSCHIPVFGKVSGTEMSRDWLQPHWNPGGCQGQGAWVGHEVRQSDVVPDYAFWDGRTSYVYDRAQTSNMDSDGYYVYSYPVGSVSDSTSKLYPFKVHHSVNPRDDSSGRMMFDILTYFTTGDAEQAARDGQTLIGETGSYSWVGTRAWQLITHGVEPAEQAAPCAQCHQDALDLNVTSMLERVSGGAYGLKGPKAQVCAQCHKDKSLPQTFERMHDGHLGRGVGCSQCHPVSRPERGLCEACDPTCTPALYDGPVVFDHGCP